MNVAERTPPAHLAIEVPAAVYTKLTGMAAEQKQKPQDYARALLLAAFSARKGPTGDNDLDAEVARLCMGPAPKSQAAGALAAQLAAANEKIAKLRRERAAETGEFDKIVAERDGLFAQLKTASEGQPVPEPGADLLRQEITQLGERLRIASQHRAVAQAATREASRLLLENSKLAADAGTARGLLAAFKDSALDTRAAALEAENKIAALIAENTALSEQAAKPDVDNIVTALVFGSAASFSVQFLAKNSGLSEDYVARVLTIWAQEIEAAKAAA